jgi:glycosyl transferase family 1
MPEVRMPTLMGCTHSRFDPASRFRFLQYVPLLEAAGWQVSHRPNRPWRHWQSRATARPLRSLEQRGGGAVRRLARWLDVREAAHFDAVFVNRDLLGTDLVFERILLERNPRVVFDFDDAVHLGSKHDHVAWMCRHAAWVTAGSPSLLDFAAQYSRRATLLPTVVDVARYRAAIPGARPQRLRVGWLGSALSIEQTLFPYLAMLGRLQQVIDFELVIVSKPRPSLPVEIAWRHVEWSPAVETAIADLFDIGIMPLVDDAFQRAKCGTKLLQYMAAGLPAIASPVGLNVALLRDSEAGFLAAVEEDWRQALLTLGADHELRHRLGARGRAYCSRNYALDRWAPVLSEILRTVAAGK